MRIKVVIYSGLLCALACGNAVWAAEDHTGTLIQQASLMYGEAEFEETLKLLKQAIRVPGNTREQLTRIYHIKGLSLGALGQYKASREAFARLLVLSPGFQLSTDVAPRIRKHFDELVRQNLKHLSLNLIPPIHAKIGKALAISLEVVSDDLKLAKSFRVWHRRGKTGEYSCIRTQLSGTGKVHVSIPSQAWQESEKTGPVSWYAVVEDENRGMLQSFGSAIHPLLVKVLDEPKPESKPKLAPKIQALPDSQPQQPPLTVAAPEPPTAWYQRWWVWTLVGGVVVASITTTLMLTSDEPAGPVHFMVDVSTSQ